MCTLFVKNLKPTKTFKTVKSLFNLSGANQEIQLDFAVPILDEKENKIYL